MVVGADVEDRIVETSADKPASRQATSSAPAPTGWLQTCFIPSASPTKIAAYLRVSVTPPAPRPCACLRRGGGSASAASFKAADREAWVERKPALTSDCASSSLSRFASAAARKKWVSGAKAKAKAKAGFRTGGYAQQCRQYHGCAPHVSKGREAAGGWQALIRPRDDGR